jgi:hypothetical protein
MKATQQIGIGEPAILEKAYDESDPEASEMTNLESRQLEKRAERNNLLALSDSKILPDRGLSESKVTEWKTYRQSLRDTNFSDPDNITWPTKPE